MRDQLLQEKGPILSTPLSIPLSSHTFLMLLCMSYDSCNPFSKPIHWQKLTYPEQAFCKLITSINLPRDQMNIRTSKGGKRWSAPSSNKMLSLLGCPQTWSLISHEYQRVKWNFPNELSMYVAAYKDPTLYWNSARDSCSYLVHQC